MLRDEALNDDDVGRAHAVRSVIMCGEWGVLGVAFSPLGHFPIPGFFKATATGRGTFLVPVILLLCTILTLFDRSSPHPPSLSLVFALLYCSKSRSIMLAIIKLPHPQPSLFTFRLSQAPYIINNIFMLLQLLMTMVWCCHDYMIVSFFDLW